MGRRAWGWTAGVERAAERARLNVRDYGLRVCVAEAVRLNASDYRLRASGWVGAPRFRTPRGVLIPSAAHCSLSRRLFPGDAPTRWFGTTWLALLLRPQQKHQPHPEALSRRGSHQLLPLLLVSPLQSLP